MGTDMPGDQAEPKVGRPIRFVLVGLLNTGIDVSILFALTWVGIALIPANIISTSVALIFSFFFNRSFTFAATGNIGVQVAKFLAVTLFGLWVLQPLVLLGWGSLLGTWPTATLSLLFAKGVATVVSMTWNYFLYERFVFGGGSKLGERGEK